MYHETTQKLVNITDNIEFERMMCDLLSSLGYVGIDPQSPGLKDNGKDALYYDKDGNILFAFSIQKKWKEKFKADLDKAKKNKINFKKFVFCSNRLLPVIERDKLIEQNKIKKISIEFFDAERIRTLLDTKYKKIREIYLGIFDNSDVKRRIRLVLLDPQNEVKISNNGEMMYLIIPKAAFGIYDVIKDLKLSCVAENETEENTLKLFEDSFISLRKSCTDLDNYILEQIPKYTDNNYIPFWKQIAYYIKLRFFGISESDAERNIKQLFNITPDMGIVLLIFDKLKEDEKIIFCIKKLGLERTNLSKYLDGLKK